MKDIFVLLVHLLTAVAKLLGPGGAKAIVAENLLSFPKIRITLITPPVVRNGDASHRLPGRPRPFPSRAAAALAILGYPSLVTDSSASGDSIRNSWSISVLGGVRSTR